MVTNDMTIALQELAQGVPAIVEEMCPDCAECQRLTTMGLTVGSMVTMTKCGQPCTLAVGRSRIVVRGESLKRILVSPLCA